MEDVRFITNSRIRSHAGVYPNWETRDIEVWEIADAPIYNTLSHLALGDIVLSFDIFDHHSYIGYILVTWDGINATKWRGELHQDGTYTKDIEQML